MKAMILNGVSNLKENRNPLTMVNIPVPVPKDMEVLIKISVCGVCHTELDEIEGRIAPIVFPVVPGHQVVGIVTELGTGTSKFKIGDRVGVAWIYSACGLCKFCLDGKENLCDHFLATGKDSYPKTKIFVFARKEEERTFAKELGAEWAGDTSNACPEKLDVIIDTTPAWKPVVEALANLKKGGRLVINAIRKEGTDKGYLQNLNYQDHLWMEKEIKSVANLTAKDVEDFLILAAHASIRPEVQIFSLEEANKALFELKERHVKGAKVLKIN